MSSTKVLRQSRRYGILLLDDGYVRAATWTYKTKKEAEDALLRWNRCSGALGHPVYAIDILPVYPRTTNGGRPKVSRRAAVRCFEKLLREVQEQRLALAEVLDRAESYVPTPE